MSGEDGDGGGRLDSLDERIRAAREARKPKRSRAQEEASAASMAWRMVTELVAGILVGGAMGYGLDVLFGTMPVFLIVMGLLGLAAGVRLVLRTGAEMGQKAATWPRTQAARRRSSR